MGWRATQVWGLKTSLVHSSAFPDSPRQAGQLQPSYCKRGMEFPGLSPSAPHTTPSGAALVGRSILYRPRVDVLGNRIPGARGSGCTGPPFGKGSEVEAIHTWCRSEGSSPASFTSPLPLLRSPEARAPCRGGASPRLVSTPAECLGTGSQSPAALSSQDLVSTLRNLCPAPGFVLPNTERSLSLPPELLLL